VNWFKEIGIEYDIVRSYYWGCQYDSKPSEQTKKANVMEGLKVPLRLGHLGAENRLIKTFISGYYEAKQKVEIELEKNHHKLIMQPALGKCIQKGCKTGKTFGASLAKWNRAVTRQENFLRISYC
jgi:hypothetical protein